MKEQSNDKCDTLYDRLVGHAKAAIENDLSISSGGRGEVASVGSISLPPAEAQLPPATATWGRNYPPRVQDF